jgi:hypothetical protein
MAPFAWAAPSGQAPTPGRGSAALRRDGLDGECARQAIIVVPRCGLAPPLTSGSIRQLRRCIPYRFRHALQRAGSGTGSATPTPSASHGSSSLPSSFLQLSRRQTLQNTSSCSQERVRGSIVTPIEESVMRAVVVSVVFSVVGVVSTVHAQDFGDVRQGRRVALDLCASCQCAPAKFYLRTPPHLASARSPTRLG